MNSTAANNQKEERNLSFGAAVAFGLIACVLYGAGAGLRCNIGILLNPLAEHCGLAYSEVSICIAVMQICFGGSQPFFGILASRRSNRFVLTLGIGMIGLSLVAMTLSRGFISLFLSLGVLFGVGAGAVSFGMILTSAIRFAGQRHAMTLAGMLNASAGMVGFILSPGLQGLLTARGLIGSLHILTIIAACLIPTIFVITSKDPKQVKAADNSADSAKETKLGFGVFREAFANRDFCFVFAAFSTCGFHMVIIESHLFSQFVLFGIEEQAASWAFSFYSIATIAGALLSGYLSARIHKGYLLASLYGFRAVWTILYLFLMPKNFLTAVIFACGLGMTGDATLSPTSGVVNERFSIEKVATLIGVLFLTHQVGAFASAWLGGIIREATGGYTMIWMIDVVLCAFAAFMASRIRDKK